MNGDKPFDPGVEAPLLSAYLDGELDAADRARVEAYLERNPSARREIDQLRRLGALTGSLRLKEAPPEDWEVFWGSVYNRVERSLGWILLLVGAALAGGWGLWRLGRTFLVAEGLPGWIKGAIIVGLAGLIVLLVSVVRERLFKRSRTRYKDVIR